MLQSYVFESWDLCLGCVGSPNFMGRSSRFGGGVCLHMQLRGFLFWG